MNPLKEKNHANTTCMSTWFGYGAWSWLLRRYPVSDVVPFTLLIPIFAMFGSTLFMGESFEPWKMTTAALVIAGLCLNLLMPRLIARNTASLSVETTN